MSAACTSSVPGTTGMAGITNRAMDTVRLSSRTFKRLCMAGELKKDVVGKTGDRPERNQSLLVSHCISPEESFSRLRAAMCKSVVDSLLFNSLNACVQSPSLGDLW